MRKILLVLFTLFLAQMYNLKAQSQFDEGTFVQNCSSPEDIFSEDFDGDGTKDILFFSQGFGRFHFLPSLGNGQFDEAVQIGSIYYQCDLIEFGTSDINNDGVMDIYYSGSAGDTNGALHTLGLFINEGNGDFDNDAIHISNFFRNDEVAAADLDGDGFPEIISTEPYAGISYFENNEGTFQLAPIEIVGFPGYIELKTIDLDGDGDIDLIANTTSENIVALLNNGSAEFVEVELIPASAQLFSGTAEHSILDIDNDGDLDIIFKSTIFTGTELIVNGVIALNDGELNFEEKIFIPTEVEPLEIVSFDADGDGDKDLVVGTDFPGEISYIQNLGQNNFSSPYSFSPAYGNFFCLSDLDGDSDPDLVACTNTGMLQFENLPANPLSNFAYYDCSFEIENTSFAYYPETNVTWDFGNGIQSTEQDPELPFTELGTYLTSLSVCMGNNNCNESSQEIEVNHIIDFEIPGSANVNEEIVFTDSSKGFSNWTWIFGDGNVSTSQVATNTYSQAGTYEIEFFLTDSTLVGCTNRFLRDIEIIGPSLPSGVDSTNDASSLNISPNPSNGFCNIEWSGNEKSEYRLYNSQGKVVRRGRLTHSQRLDISELPKGMYIFETTTHNHLKAQKKIFVLGD